MTMTYSRSEGAVVITAPGIYDLPAAAYFADPCPVPSLSRGIAHTLIRRSPRRAYHQHPRLGGQGDITPTRAMDDGSVLHSLLLGKGAEIAPITAVYGPKHDSAGQPVTDFATKAAREERDELRTAGKIPVLQHRIDGLYHCADTIRDLLRKHEDAGGFFAPGMSEAVIVWREDDVWLRCMVDRLPDDSRAPPYDLKLTDLSAAPGGWERRLQTEYAFQCAFYRRGIAAVRGIEPQPMRFIVGELEPPHDVAVMAAAPALRALAEAEVERAIQLWRRCMRSGRWPGYPPLTAWVEPTAWQMNTAEEQALRDEMMEDVS